MSKITNREAADKIAAREEFVNSRGSFRGTFHTPGNRVDQSYAWSKEDADELLQAEYIVWSYNTIIGWFGLQDWHEVDRTFSSATTRHQHQLRMGMSR